MRLSLLGSVAVAASSDSRHQLPQSCPIRSVFLHEDEAQGSEAPGSPPLQTGRWEFSRVGKQPFLAQWAIWGQVGWSSSLDEKMEKSNRYIAAAQTSTKSEST